MPTYIITDTVTDKGRTVQYKEDLYELAEKECPDNNIWFQKVTARKLLEDQFSASPESVDTLNEDDRAASEWIVDLADRYGWDTMLYRADHLWGYEEYTDEKLSKREAAVATLEHDHRYSVQVLPSTVWRFYDGTITEEFDSLQKAYRTLQKREYRLVTSAACDHSDLEADYFIHQEDVDEWYERHGKENPPNIENLTDEECEELMDVVYGHGYEPQLIPVVIEED